MKIACVGDVGIDNYINLGLVKPGGIAFNFAYDLVLSGEKDVSIVSVIGDDSEGEKIMSLLKKNGFRIDHVNKTNGFTPEQKIILKNGERNFVGYRQGVLNGWKLDSSKIDFLKSQDVIFVPLSDGLEKVFAKVKKIESVFKVVDFSSDYEFADFDKRSNIVTKNAKYFDMLFIGGESVDLNMLTKMSKKYPLKIFVLTLGDQGGFVLYKGNKEYFSAIKADEVIDTTGCGDIFQATFLSYYLRTKSITNSLYEASKRASEKVSRIGSTNLII